jgi:hypothetical protein
MITFGLSSGTLRARGIRRPGRPPHHLRRVGAVLGGAWPASLPRRRGQVHGNPQRAGHSSRCCAGGGAGGGGRPGAALEGVLSVVALVLLVQILPSVLTAEGSNRCIGGRRGWAGGGRRCRRRRRRGRRCRRRGSLCLRLRDADSGLQANQCQHEPNLHLPSPKERARTSPSTPRPGDGRRRVDYGLGVACTAPKNAIRIRQTACCVRRLGSLGRGEPPDMFRRTRAPRHVGAPCGLPLFSTASAPSTRKHFAAPYPARQCPCQRFAGTLAGNAG